MLCTPWRVIAPVDAAVVVRLPLVPGGTVAAPLAATIAREQQRVVEEAATKQSTDLPVRADEVDGLPQWQRAVIEEALERIVAGRGQPSLYTAETRSQWIYRSLYIPRLELGNWKTVRMYGGPIIPTTVWAILTPTSSTSTSKIGDPHWSRRFSHSSLGRLPP